MSDSSLKAEGAVQLFCNKLPDFTHLKPNFYQGVSREGLLARVRRNRDGTPLVTYCTEQRIHTFPGKLMALLQQDGVDDAMWWLPDGDAFGIHPQRFIDSVLESHLRCKYESFTRKLNRCEYICHQCT